MVEGCFRIVQIKKKRICQERFLVLGSCIDLIYKEVLYYKVLEVNEYGYVEQLKWILVWLFYESWCIFKLIYVMIYFRKNILEIIERQIVMVQVMRMGMLEVKVSVQEFEEVISREGIQG